MIRAYEEMLVRLAIRWLSVGGSSLPQSIPHEDRFVGDATNLSSRLQKTMNEQQINLTPAHKVEHFYDAGQMQPGHFDIEEDQNVEDIRQLALLFMIPYHLASIIEKL